MSSLEESNRWKLVARAITAETLIVDQCLPDFAMHDAIGAHVLEVRRVLREAGYESEIWADRIDERLGGQARPYKECPPDRRGALIYQMSTDSDMASWVEEKASSGYRVASNYHNITPSEYFRRWEPSIGRKLEVAREQLVRLAPCTEVGLPVSHYNESELQAAGYRRTVVTPLLVDLAGLNEPADARLLERLNRKPGTRWLFVGRLAPNKCQHDVVAAFAIYRRLFDPKATLTLIGSPSSYRYLRAVQRLAADIGVEESVEFVSNLGTRQLAAYYAAADVFTCLSEHEGFCVPLLESMALGLPVVAYDAGAVSETLAGAGVTLDTKDPLEVAVRVHDLLNDANLRLRNLEAGKARAKELSLESTAPQFLKAISDWLGESKPADQ